MFRPKRRKGDMQQVLTKLAELRKDFNKETAANKSDLSHLFLCYYHLCLAEYFFPKTTKS